MSRGSLITLVFLQDHFDLTCAQERSHNITQPIGNNQQQQQQQRHLYLT